ncbi:TraR/DksA C4-type zinc finger protein [Variovorax soli]|uniref:RNA polymerase-binding transcription factor DksA n=1 Tax=Variovorax soli TaxID=376815 RepID=A0ABU1NE18_9BURK|nr:TraR/DksA C4-type zinc finger protein [Variovorax soli]MDR6536557.1 RNA polymerase-binding transcription factor DksA [Variovorax soli]
MTHLSSEQMQQIEALLAKRESELRSEVHMAKEAGVASPEARPREVKDSVDDADERFLEGLDHVQLLRDQEELRDIQAARQRIRDGSYGRCAECDAPIDFGRLRARPTAQLCLQHQAEWESRNPMVPPFAT